MRVKRYCEREQNSGGVRDTNFRLAQNLRRGSYRRVKFRSMFKAKRGKKRRRKLYKPQKSARAALLLYLLERFKNVLTLKFNAYR